MKTRIANYLILVACFSIVKCMPLPKDSSPEGPIATQIKLPALFSDHMVLQQDKPVKVWGWAEPGGVVTATFRGEKKRARAGADGAWHLNLRAHKAGGPFTMQIMGQDTLVLTDILIGEVWICSGQSNMQWPVRIS